MNFYLPTVPYSAIDLCNRRAAATGSVGYAMATANANYNGHRIGITFNTYRGYWIAEHHWGERVVWCRGSLANCLSVARQYHNRGDKGAAVVAHYRLRSLFHDHNPPESVMQFAAQCAAAGLAFGEEPSPLESGWWTPKHNAVVDAMHMSNWAPGFSGLACSLPDTATAEDWAAVRDAELRRRGPAVRL